MNKYKIHLVIAILAFGGLIFHSSANAGWKTNAAVALCLASESCRGKAIDIIDNADQKCQEGKCSEMSRLLSEKGSSLINKPSKN